MSYNLYAILIEIIYLFFTKINLFNVIDQKEINITHIFLYNSICPNKIREFKI